MFKGMPNDSYFDACWKHANESIKDKPNLCAVPDLESGLPIIMTNEERQKLIDIFESCKPSSLINKSPGKIIIFGTGGENTFKD